MAKSYLGYQEKDLQSSYASFFQAQMEGVQEHVLAKVSNPLTWEDLPEVEEMTLLEETGEMPVETGFSVAEDG
ncbi:MAG: hypothetical protein AAF806_15500, partial [Bacteroidota bacterium]